MPDTPGQPLTEVEQVKTSSRYLRGTIAESLADHLTGAVAKGDTHLLKFHGTYQQDDRDLRKERARQKLEPAYEFMVRIRVPGGVLMPEQWLAIDRIAREYANGTIRLTSRQSLQLHGVSKWELREVFQAINRSGLTTMAASGDVNRNIVCAANPQPPELHAELVDWSRRIGDHLAPHTTAYADLWLAETPGCGPRDDREPLYGPAYLPRKFKIAVAAPPSNDVDVFTNDLGLIAIIESGRIAGFNVSVGGGLGMSHGKAETFPALGQVIGFCEPGQVIDLAEKVLLVERDFGDRTNRRHARLKYILADRSVEWFQGELHARLGWTLRPPRDYQFEYGADPLGWTEGPNGTHNLTLFIECGRAADVDGYPLLSILCEIADRHRGQFRLTPNHNLVVSGVPGNDRPRIEQLVREYQLDDGTRASPVRHNALACVALPTCGQAAAESERYLPRFITKLEAVLAEAGLEGESIGVRMTGCPNGCSRPYLAEIGIVGRAAGKYNLYLGGDAAGRRLNQLYREKLVEAELLDALRTVLNHYARERMPGEPFGAFALRAGCVAPG
ncbi:MAG: NADPH-dependent assimilatory sulfite reductase hemoprotein subunit [Thermoguttaceae bacterium]|nr:NADPH-dependent assimilatory sulfite reductase hemoprotein subunit [Thermoguttaceae bacterium]